MFSKLVKDAVRLPTRLHTKGDIGIEIELEGSNIDRNCPLITRYWDVVHDGSLNDIGKEFVLKSPISIKSSYIPLKYLEKSFSRSNAHINDSIRCGCHIHVNVQDLTVAQMWTFVSLYIALEEVLVDLCGEGRQGNLFCLRLKDAEHLLQYINESIKIGDLKALGTTNIRYASVNLSSLVKYGSVEFRAMKGDRNFNRINAWAKTLINLRDMAVEIGSPDRLTSVANDVEALGNIAYKIIDNYFLPIKTSLKLNEQLRSGINYSRLINAIYSNELNSFKLKNGTMGKINWDEVRFAPPAPPIGDLRNW